MDEFDLIEQIVQALGAAADSALTQLGPGDDAAVMTVPPGHEVVSSIDTLLADVHFPGAAPPHLIGYRAVMVAASDIAAMGAKPFYQLLALSLPHGDQAWVREFSRGVAEAAMQCALPVVGGNLSRGGLAISVSVHGLVPSGGALTRRGAQAGDLLQVTGLLGGAAACVRQQLFDVTQALSPSQERYFRPRARLDMVDALAGVKAAIDISDGLLQDLGHLLKASSHSAPLAAEIASDVMPVHPDAELTDALSGGDDYELLIAAATELPGCHTIGRVCAGTGILLDGKPVTSSGYQHFGAQ